MKSVLLICVVLTLRCDEIRSETTCDAGNADKTLKPGTSGEDVVKAAVKKIQDSGIFPDDKGFLERIAAVESRCGEDKNTYRDGYHGGIWQVDKGTFESSRNPQNHPGVTEKMNEIKEKLGIDWTQVTWSDLRCPLYSAIAARLMLSNIVEAIPGDLKGQAEYWKKHYNTEDGDGTEQDFIDRVQAKGDPHVSQLVPGSHTPLCYDVFGHDGDVYNFLEEPSLGNLKVTAMLKSRTGKGGKQTAKVIGECTVRSQGHSIQVDQSGTTIDGHLSGWQEGIHHTGDVTVTITTSRVEIDAGLVIVDVDKTGSRIDLTIQHVGRFPDSAAGLVGSVADSVEIVESGSDAYLLVTDTGDMMKLTKRQGCWRLHNPAPGFQNLLDQACISCSHSNTVR